MEKNKTKKEKTKKENGKNEKTEKWENEMEINLYISKDLKKKIREELKHMKWKKHLYENRDARIIRKAKEYCGKYNRDN